MSELSSHRGHRIASLNVLVLGSADFFSKHGVKIFQPTRTLAKGWHKRIAIPNYGRTCKLLVL